MKKRILVLLTVVAVMVAMLAMSVAPAFGAGGGFGYAPTPFFTCSNPNTLEAKSFVTPQNLSLVKSQGYTDCVLSGVV
jgi:hypothetical protein